MNRLKELRQEKKLTQQELAHELQVPVRTYQRWESGESQIKPDKADNLAAFFGVSVGYLLGYSEYRQLESALRKEPFENYEDIQDFSDDIASFLGYENTPKFFDYVNSQFLKEFENSHVPAEIVTRHRDDFYTTLQFSPHEIVKINTLWAALTDEERIHIMKIIEFLAFKN